MDDSDRQWLADRFDRLDARLDRMHRSKGELEQRVRTLEIARATLAGIAAVITAAGAWVASHVEKLWQ